MTTAYGDWIYYTSYCALRVKWDYTDAGTSCAVTATLQRWDRYANAAQGSVTLWMTDSGSNNASFAANGNNETKDVVSLGSHTFSKSHSTYSISATAGTSSYFACITDSGYYRIGEQMPTWYFTVPTKWNYAISYDANGGTGAPSGQTKWHGETLALTSSTPSREGHTFNGWNTNSSGTGTNYAAGASYTGNAALNLYAKWTVNTYAVTFNANGGSGAPSAQTKTHGTALTLSSTKPTRTNYKFLGWATSASATSAQYCTGSSNNQNTSYTTDAPVTLYAVWELQYIPPKITNLTCFRSDASGNSADEGTRCKVSFTYITDTTLSASNYATVTAKVGSVISQIPMTVYKTGYSINASGNEVATNSFVILACNVEGFTAVNVTYTQVYSNDVNNRFHAFNSNGTWLEQITTSKTTNGTYTVSVSLPSGTSELRLSTRDDTKINFVSDGTILVAGSDHKTGSNSYSGVLPDTGLNVNSTYQIAITVSDVQGGSTSASTVLSQAFFTMDFKSGGHGVAIGKPATTADLFDVGMASKFTDVTLTGTLTLPSQSRYYVLAAPTTSGGGVPTFRRLAAADIGSGTLSIARGGTAASTAANALKNIMAGKAVLYDNASGTNGTVTLSQTAANFDHMRIYAKTNYGCVSVDVYSPNGKEFTMTAISTDDTATTTMYFIQQRRAISGTSITVHDNGYGYFDSFSNTTVNATAYMSIVRVEAWNEA